LIKPCIVAVRTGCGKAKGAQVCFVLRVIQFSGSAKGRRTTD
jgi:hypothetical protein